MRHSDPDTARRHRLLRAARRRRRDERPDRVGAGWLYIPKTTEGDKLDAAKKFLAFVASPDRAVRPDSGRPADRSVRGQGLHAARRPSGRHQDLQPYVDGGNNSPALEFLSPVKGPNLEKITVEVGSGIRMRRTGAKLYDEDVKKQAQQLGPRRAGDCRWVAACSGPHPYRPAISDSPAGSTLSALPTDGPPTMTRHQCVRRVGPRRTQIDPRRNARREPAAEHRRQVLPAVVLPTRRHRLLRVVHRPDGRSLLLRLHPLDPVQLHVHRLRQLRRVLRGTRLDRSAQEHADLRLRHVGDQGRASACCWPCCSPLRSSPAATCARSSSSPCSSAPSASASPSRC